ncbi:amidohydrolase family protein [Occultella gossypii]|uniref:amidohydrolase family protein n=1 Tax=Occultella gossypii TaxID=2800820 RepID=UPI0035565EB8
MGAQVVDHVMGAFGPHRLLYGSNWPIVDLCQEGYDGSIGVLQSYLSELSPTEIDQVVGGAAGRIYAGS